MSFENQHQNNTPEISPEDKLRQKIADIEHQLKMLEVFASDPGETRVDQDEDKITELRRELLAKKEELYGSFDDLYIKIRNAGTISGTSGNKEYSSEDLIKTIEEVRTANRGLRDKTKIWGLQFITRSGGIKDRVQSLLEIEIEKRNI